MPQVTDAERAGVDTSTIAVTSLGQRAADLRAAAKAWRAKKRGEKLAESIACNEVGDSPTSSGHLSKSAAAVVGMCRKRYEQAKVRAHGSR